MAKKTTMQPSLKTACWKKFWNLAPNRTRSSKLNAERSFVLLSESRRSWPDYLQLKKSIFWPILSTRFSWCLNALISFLWIDRSGVFAEQLLFRFSNRVANEFSLSLLMIYSFWRITSRQSCLLRENEKRSETQPGLFRARPKGICILWLLRLMLYEKQHKIIEKIKTLSASPDLITKRQIIGYLEEVFCTCKTFRHQIFVKN